MDQINFPDMMTSGFNFDEAITMAELCRRVYKVFENQYIKKPKELYEALYEDDEWEFIHSISDYKTDGRALILKRKDKNQFAVVFRGTVFTSGGLEFTGQQGNEDIRLAEYESIPSEPTPPSNNVRVYAGLMNGFKALRNQLEFFFDVLFNGVNEKHIIKAISLSEEQRKNILSTIYNAYIYRLNKQNENYISIIKSQKTNDIEDIKIKNLLSLDKFLIYFSDLEKININDKNIIESLSIKVDKIIKIIELNVKNLLKLKIRINKLEEIKPPDNLPLEQIPFYIYEFRKKYNQIIGDNDIFDHYSLDVIHPTSPEISEFISNFRKQISEIERGCINFKDTVFEGEEVNKIYITGHSRGAGLATFAALHLKRYFNSKKGPDRDPVSIKKYSVGSTKVGNKAFVEYYNEQMKGFSYRIQNLMDAAIYFPLPTSIPFPYNLQLMIPGIDYVREGELYHAYYEHVGEAYTLFGFGNQNLDLGFGGPLNFTIPVPFSHGPDGYKQMLIDHHEWQETFFGIIGDFFNLRFEMYQQAFKNIYEQSTRLESKVDNISDSLNDHRESIQKINKILETYSPPPQDASSANQQVIENGVEEKEGEQEGKGNGFILP